jgi:hypothetical protein
MADSTKPPLRGEAAWRASRDAVAKRNEAARAAGAQRRAAKEADAAAEAARRDRSEAIALRKQAG